MSERYRQSMIGRRVAGFWPSDEGIVQSWEPLGAAMTDVLIKYTTKPGSCWHSSACLRPIDGLGPLPTRVQARRLARAKAKAQLRAIREAHVRDFNKPWPGLEFAKAHFGQMIDGAIAKLEDEEP